MNMVVLVARSFHMSLAHLRCTAVPSDAIYKATGGLEEGSDVYCLSDVGKEAVRLMYRC